jgi:hypothetical protein
MTTADHHHAAILPTTIDVVDLTVVDLVTRMIVTLHPVTMIVTPPTEATDTTALETVMTTDPVVTAILEVLTTDTEADHRLLRIARLVAAITTATEVPTVMPIHVVMIVVLQVLVPPVLQVSQLVEATIAMMLPEILTEDRRLITGMASLVCSKKTFYHSPVFDFLYPF